jgi:hypothetical protein
MFSFPSFKWTVNNRPNSLVQTVSNLSSNFDLQQRLQSLGLSIQLVSWEDTGRYKNSCWGPNITDQTLKVTDKSNNKVSMPVIRKPNYTDETCDVDINQFFVAVGNEKGSATLERMTLKNYLIKLGLRTTFGRWLF